MSDADALRTLLGIDVEELDWQDLSLCHDTDTNLFYDDYESDTQVAKMIDQMCLSCPVMKQCLERGIDNGEWGVWGGIYLTSGRPDTNKNIHKTQEVWEQVREKIGDESL